MDWSIVAGRSIVTGGGSYVAEGQVYVAGGVSCSLERSTFDGGV